MASEPRLWRRAAVILLMLLASFAAPITAADDERPVLTGSWVLNKDLSADPAGTLEGPRRRGGRMPIGGQGGGIGGPVGGGVSGPIIGGRRGGFEEDPDEAARMRERISSAVARALPRLRRSAVTSR